VYSVNWHRNPEDAIDGGNNSTAAFAQARNEQTKDGAGAGSPNQLFYAARVTLDRTAMKVDGKTVNLAPGMAATVEIRTGKRKLIEFLLSPLMRMTQEAGRER
jgi:hemolysin D